MSIRCATAIAAVAGVAAAASADDLLIVDLTTPNEVTITATGGLSAATVSGGDTTGVYLDMFYGGAGGSLSADLVFGDLTNAENPSDGSPSLFRGGGGTDTGLNIWSWSSDSTVTFTAGSLAFVGSGNWTLDASEYADMIAGGNRGGDLYFPADTSDDVPTATYIGTYAVRVPSPAALSLLGAGLGFGAIRRRR